MAMGAYLTCLRCGHHLRVTEMAAHAGPHTAPPPRQVVASARRDALLTCTLLGVLTAGLALGLRAALRCVRTR
jgi:hypothetical protein